MAVSAIAQKCISLLNALVETADQAVAFGPEVQAMRNKLAELRCLFGEFTVKANWEESHLRIIEAIHVVMRRFWVVVSACSLQGPIQTLLTADELLHELVDSCLSVQREVEKLYSERIPTLVLAQAKMISAQLNTTTLNFEALRRLHNLRYKLLEEAERVRLGTAEGSTFTSLISNITAGCTSEQLSSDIAFLQQRLAKALAAEHLVQAYFLKLAASSLEAQLPQPAALAGTAQPATRPQSGQPPSSMDPSAETSPQSQHTRGGSEQQPVLTDVSSALAKLTCNSATPAERHAALKLLCRALEGQATDEAVEALTEAGLGVVFRLVASSDTKLRVAALRMLVALVAVEPSFAGQLVAVRGVPVLMHILGCYLEDARRWQGAMAGLQTATDTGAVTINISAASPVSRKGQAGYGHSKAAVAVGASSPQQRSATPAAAVVQPSNEALGSSNGPDEAMCVYAITLLRYLFQAHMAELLSAGAIPSLCRVAAVPFPGRAPSTAATALADAAQDGNAAVQMLQNRLLVILADIIRSDRPSEIAVAEACLAALLKHPSRLADPSDGSAVQSATDMGRACDAASVTVLLDTASAGPSGEAAASSSCKGLGSTVRQSVFQLLPYCLHSNENRAALLHHGPAMSLLLQGASSGNANAAGTYKRLAADEVSVNAVARQLSQALVGTGAPNGSSRQAAALALVIADIMRPTIRDRSAMRWATDACGEVQQCGALPVIMDLAASTDATCRAAGLACLHGLAMYGNHATQVALGGCGSLVTLIDAVKLEGLPLPDALQPPICNPHTLGQAAAEALAAIASSAESARRDICMQLCSFLGSSCASLAASACLALNLVIDTAPAAASVLASQGVMPNLVAHIARAPPVSAPSQERDATPAETQQTLLQTRATQLMLALCRGGGDTVDAAVSAGAAAALFQRASSAPDIPLRVQAAAALGPMLKKSAPAREAVDVIQGVWTLLRLAREAHPSTALLDEALGALAALASFHAPSRVEALRELRQMMIRGRSRDMAAAAVVVARMSSGPAGREAVLAEEFSEPLVKLLTTGDDRAKAAAATAIRHLAVPATLQLPKCPLLPAGGPVRPRLVLVRAGAVSALLALLRDSGGEQTGASSQASQHGVAVTSQDMTPVVCAAEALESLAGGEEGVQAIRAAGGTEVLKEIVARGKRRLVPAGAMQAASSALMQCV